jgi:hypothetical protein
MKEGKPKYQNPNVKPSSKATMAKPEFGLWTSFGF